MVILKLISVSFFWLILLNSVHAHSGRLDSSGCHNDRKNGGNHCHSKGSRESTLLIPNQTLDEYVSHPVVVPISNSKDNNLLELDYEGYTLWIDCRERAVIKFRYNVQRDTGNLKRHDKFEMDPDVPTSCQQFSNKAYGNGYDRGHQVPVNHLDASVISIHQSNYMTNILPQISQMNRGAWLLTEEIIECYRDIDDLLVIGGIVWGNDTSNDIFVHSHGIRTPDYFYKVIIRGTINDERVIAWVVPNSTQATKNNLDSYLVTIAELENMTGELFPVEDYLKHDKPSSSWLIPKGCNKG